MDCSFHWKPNSVCVSVLWKPFFCCCCCWTIDFLSHSLRNASSQSRRSWLLFHPQVPPALLCFAGSVVSGEMPACCCLSPYPFFILASSCPSIHLSIYPSLLETGPPSDWVNESRVPLKASRCCNFLRCLVTFCIRWDVLSGPVGGWVGGQLLSCGLFLCFFYFRL